MTTTPKKISAVRAIFPLAYSAMMMAIPVKKTCAEIL